MSDFFKPQTGEKIVIRLLPTKTPYAYGRVHKISCPICEKEKEMATQIRLVCVVDLETGKKFQQSARKLGKTPYQLLQSLVRASAEQSNDSLTINDSEVSVRCQEPTEETPNCTCDIKDLMVQGCKCGFLGSGK